ncbi:unnamed protein product [Ranitomeya imitator]|uniref:Uncharacterized protein n=1 Tax=Ranitomeya imitator TaxID=111125 RepID=A0ABN9LNV2_9NEOB|nr:unnamed protein product [Ranitomeya imitator]
MSSETYMYDDATGSTILSKIRTNTDFLHIPNRDIKTRDWEKEKKRLIAYNLHCATLGEYHRQGKIPRGLRCNLRPTLFSDNEKYCTTFQKILNKCSFDIILLTIEYLQEAIKETEERIITIETQLTSTLTNSEFNTLKSKVDSILSSHQKTLEERKRTKFQRDTEDYLTNRVYRWDETTHRRPYPRSRRPAGRYVASGDSSPAGGSSPGSGSDIGGASSTTRTLFLVLSGRPPGGREGKDRERQMTLRSQLEKDLQSFYRNLRLKVHFEDNPHVTSNTLGTVPDRDRGPLITLDQLGLRNPSKFMPPKTNHAIETFITLLDRDIKETIRDQRLGFLPVRHNVTPLEKQALTSLKDNNHIIIKPADEGGATVVMNKNQYVAEIKRQLADTTTYRKIQSDPVYNIRRKIDTILTKHTQLQTIDAKTKTFLTNDHPILSLTVEVYLR